MPYSPMQKSCMKMKDHKGKTTGLMMEGSAMHMSMLHKESDEQEKKDLLKDMPVDDKASALEMGHESPAQKHGAMKGDQSKTRLDYQNYKGTDPHYHGKDGSSHGEQSVSKADYESPAEFTGMSGGSAMKMGHESPAKQTDERDGTGKNVDKDGNYMGTRFHYKDKKYDKSVRELFEDSFKTAKAAGAKTFDFHHSGVKDPKTGIYKFKGGTYTTETK